MNIQKLTLGLYQTNTYILSNDTEAAVIDPGYEPDIILDALEGRELKAILLTHGHFDHVGAVKDLVAETDCKVYIHEGDLALPPQFTAGPLYYTDLYKGGITIEADYFFLGKCIRFGLRKKRKMMRLRTRIRRKRKRKH